MVPKFLTLWGDPLTPHLCWYQVLEVFNYYSWSYKYPKIRKIMKFCTQFYFEENLWTCTLNNFYTFICFNNTFFWLYYFEWCSDILGIFRINLSNFSYLLLYNHPNYEFFRKIFQKTDALIILLSWRVIYAYKYVLIKFDIFR